MFPFLHTLTLAGADNMSNPSTEQSSLLVHDRVPTSILLDALLQAFFLGIILGQAAYYWSDYGDDSKRKRLLVAIVVLLSMLVFILLPVSLAA